MFLFQSILSFWEKLKNSLRVLMVPIKKYARRRPLVSFLLLLALLLGIIVLGDQLRKPPVDTTSQEQEPKQVQGYRIGSTPRITVMGKVEKSGVITMVAQSSGIVQKINLKEGSTVTKGQRVASLSTNYQGAVLPGVQRQISQTNYNFQKNTYAIQKDIIAKNRDSANKADENSDKLREITRDSRDRTREVIDRSKESITLLDSLISYYEGLASSVTNDQTIVGLRQQKVGLLNGLSAAESALRSADYQENGDNIPAHLSDLSREVANKQLDLQEKSLDLNLEIARLNVQVATIAESLMYPTSPFNGRVERIHVKVGESVNPGDPIATIAGNVGSISVIALVSRNVARSVSTVEPTTITIGQQSFDLIPTHIAEEPTDGRLFAIVYTLPQLGPASMSISMKGYDASSSTLDASRSSDGEYVSLSIPVGAPDTNSIIPFIPLDSIFQSQDKAIVFVDQDGVATSREVHLGQVMGRYAEVKEGLGQGDVVLLDRGLIEGDKVTIR